MGWDFYLCRAISRSELKKRKELNKYGQVMLPPASGEILLPNTYSFSGLFLEDLIGYKNMIEFVHNHLDCVVDAVEPTLHLSRLLNDYGIKTDKNVAGYDIKEILYYIDGKVVSEYDYDDFENDCRLNRDGRSMDDLKRIKQRVLIKSYDNDEKTLAEFDLELGDELWKHEDYNIHCSKKIFCYDSIEWLGGKSTVEEWPHHVTDKYKPDGFCEYIDHFDYMGTFITTTEDLKEFQKNARDTSPFSKIKELKPNEFIKTC